MEIQSHPPLTEQRKGGELLFPARGEELELTKKLQFLHLSATATHEQKQSLRYSAASFNGGGRPVGEDELSRSVPSAFGSMEEEIERKKKEIRDKFQAHLKRVQEEIKRLDEIKEEFEGITDPMEEEVTTVRKRIDIVGKELIPLGLNCQKKEKEYREAVKAFNAKIKEETQLAKKLKELVSESERLRMKKLEELSRNL